MDVALSCTALSDKKDILCHYSRAGIATLLPKSLARQRESKAKAKRFALFVESTAESTRRVSSLSGTEGACGTEWSRSSGRVRGEKATHALSRCQELFQPADVDITTSKKAQEDRQEVSFATFDGHLAS